MRVVYIACSIDGNIARTDQSLDRLESYPHPQGNDYGYEDFFSQVGSIIIGRKTYEHLLTLITPEARPYANVESFIISRHADVAIKTPQTTHRSGDLVSLFAQCEHTSSKHIRIVGGGELIGSCLSHDLIDRMIITTIPVILGEGIPLFPRQHLTKDVGWTTHIQHYDNGVYTVTYDREK